MEGNKWGYSSNEDTSNDDDDVNLLIASDEEEDFHFTSHSLPKSQFRNVKSKATWNEEMGMAEVIEKNGKMWVSSGIVRSGKIYTSIEETL